MFSISAARALELRQWAATDGLVSAAACLYLRMKALSCVSVTSHLHLNNLFSVSGCSTYNPSFVYQPP